ncbi:VCBS repeat-containing protein [bacterium]|nr:VCBS repeat-containing protein [bacterium]
MNRFLSIFTFSFLLFFLAYPAMGFERMEYHHPGLTVDLGVGLWAWPLPMDFDGDGDNDLLVNTQDKPYNGLYFFENREGNVKYPTFKPGVRLGEGKKNVQISYVKDMYKILTPGILHADYKTEGLGGGEPFPYKPSFYTGRSNHWRLVDYDGDGVRDLIIGASDWRDYGWDNAYNEKGEWTRGPLHAHLYFVRNHGSHEKPDFSNAEKIQAGGQPIDVFGMPSPNLADWDGDGDLDIICGEFLDRFTYFENIGTRTKPRYAEGRYLKHQDELLAMDLEMIIPIAMDWDKDGDVDLIVGQEDGRVALVENRGELKDGLPLFSPPRFFQQEAAYVKFGALVTPCSYDWDHDGDEDLICGNTAGYIGWIENLDGGNPPRWAAPDYLKANGEVIRIQAGKNGSIQGPAEAKWGYTVLDVADWNHDGLPDIVVNSIWGKVIWFENHGTRQAPRLKSAQPIQVEWPGKPPKPAWNWWEPKKNHLVTQWRTSPVVDDLNGDGLNDLIMLDHEGYLSFFQRAQQDGEVVLLPGKRIFKGENGEPLRLNERKAGKSGRRKFTLVDWDGDGRLDILLNSENVDFMRNIAKKPGEFIFQNRGAVHEHRLAGHTTCPTVVDWNRDSVPDLLVGAEDGHLYYLKNPF